MKKQNIEHGHRGIDGGLAHGRRDPLHRSRVGDEPIRILRLPPNSLSEDEVAEEQVEIFPRLRLSLPPHRPHPAAQREREGAAEQDQERHRRRGVQPRTESNVEKRQESEEHVGKAEAGRDSRRHSAW